MNPCLASLDIGKGRRAQLLAHGEPEVEIPEIINDAVRKGGSQAEGAGVKIPPGGYAYLLGVSPQGWRYIVGARINRFPSDGKAAEKEIIADAIAPPN